MTSDHVDAEFSELHENSLSSERARVVTAHLAACERCRAEYERFRAALTTLSSLGKAPPPRGFPDRVEHTIERRSQGRFFGHTGFRVPYELIGLVAILVGVAVVLLLRFSATGVVHEPLKHKAPPPVAPGARDVIPVP